MKNGYDMNSMKPVVKDCQKPASSYSQSYDQSTLNYKERQDKIQSKEASKLKAQKYSGRY